MQSTKLTKSDYLIKLNEIPTNGETYAFSKNAKDISQFISDLTGGGEYSVELTILPMGNVYQVSGRVKSTIALDCSRCGQDTEEICNESISEILMVGNKERPRGSREGRSQETDHTDGPFCNFLDKPQLHIGDFVREIIASATPYLSYCGKSNCEETLLNATKTAVEAKITPENPFAQLADIKGKLRPQ